MAHLYIHKYLCIGFPRPFFNYLFMALDRNSYTADDKLTDLIEDNQMLLVVMNRFGISFGFGEKTVGEVCRKDGVDCQSFLAVCNLVSGLDYTGCKISLPSLMAYLRSAHAYFLEFLLPSIRRKLIESINCSDVNDIAFLLLKFFDDYVQEVHNHMTHENDVIFSYVTKLLDGESSDNFRITDYSLEHGSMAEKLTELKEIFICHYHERENPILTSALMDIIYCGKELTNHCKIENMLFIPNVEKLEKSVRNSSREKETERNTEIPAESLIESMTAREKEILSCVAKGMANKEIADHLCLSIHTVTTYRRNISAKLQIHSTAGLTIFAILHQIIDIREVNPHI